MLGAVEVRQFLDKFIDILLVGSVDPPISEQLGVEERFFCGFGVGVDAGFEYFQLNRRGITIEFRSISFFLCCTLTCRISLPTSLSSSLL